MDGVIVTHVQRRGAAEQAGIKKDDVIYQIEDINVTGKGSFEEAISYHYPGDKITVNFHRGNRQNSANLTLQNLEGGTGTLKREFFTSNVLGARLETVNAIERDRLDIPYGVKVSGVTRGYMRDLGLGNGFILTHINKEPAKDPNEVGVFLEKYSGKLLLEGLSPNGQRFMQSYNVR